MKPVTREMIKKFDIKKTKYDFMGYTFSNTEQLSFHHLIVPKRECKSCGLGDGYLFWNGAILRQDTSHDYLHLIERVDRDAFLAITQEMVLQNKQGHLDIENLKRIRIILEQFEALYKGMPYGKDGKKLIKRKYITDRIDL